MTKKQKIRNKKKKIVVITVFMVLLLIISAITTVTVIHYLNNNELEEILYYNEYKEQGENELLIVGINDKNELIQEENGEGEISNEENPAQNVDNNANENKSNKTEQKDVSDAPYYIKVNYKANVVTVYKKDNSGNYTVPFKAMLCSCGDYTPPCKKYPDKIYTMPGGKNTRFVWGRMQGNVYAQYATRITGSILFHSVPYTKQDKSTLEWEEYDKLGTKASLGCIRLSVKDAKWIYDNCKAGTIVEFYSDSNPGPLGKPSAQKISGDTEVRGWDPTDPDKKNPWPAYLKKKEEAAAAAKAAEEEKKAEEKKIQETSTKPVEDKTNTTTKPVEDKTNTTNKTQGTNTTPVENKITEQAKNNSTSDTTINKTENTTPVENKTTEQAKNNEKIKEEKLKVKCSLGVSSIMTASGYNKGIFVEAEPEGGSGNYKKYSIKLYYNGNLIKEGTDKELFLQTSNNGTYSATVTVTDSNGSTATDTKTITKS